MFACFVTLIGLRIVSGYSTDATTFQFKNPSEPLFLTPFIQTDELETARKLSTVKPFLKSVQSHSGYLTADPRYNSNLFFWYFVKSETAPLIVWLQGGPGSSCMFGIFVEHGPYQFNKKNMLRKRKYAWTENFNVLYIDNPVGVGFSFTNNTDGYARNQTMIAHHLYEILKQFLQLFPYLQKNKIVLSGESYGGKYAPALAHLILHNNEISDFKINLYGVFIGNPFFSPENMLDHGEFLYSHGLVDAHGMKMMQEREEHVKVLIKAQKWTEATDLFEKTFFEGIAPNRATLLKALTGFDQHFHTLKEALSINTYYKSFLRNKNILKALHMSSQTYGKNTTDVYYYLKEDIMKSMSNVVGEVMEKTRLAIYTGLLDILCPYYLQEKAIRSLNWKDAAKYHKTERKGIIINQTVVGYFKAAGKFTDITVRNSGHLVAKDQPKMLLQILQMFLDGYWD